MEPISSKLIPVKIGNKGFQERPEFEQRVMSRLALGDGGLLFIVRKVKEFHDEAEPVTLHYLHEHYM